MSKFVLPLLEPRFHLLYEVIKIKGYLLKHELDLTLFPSVNDKKQ